MALTAQVVIQVDDSNPSAALQQLNNTVKQLDPAFQQVGARSGSVMDKMTGDYTRGRQAAMLLSETIGLNIPRALDQVLARSSLIGPALNAAFGVIAVAGFIEVAGRAAEGVENVVESITHWKKSAEDMMSVQGAWNQMFIDAQKRTEDFNKALQLVGLEGTDLLAKKARQAKDAVSAQEAAVAKLVSQLHDLQKTSQQTEMPTFANAYPGTAPQPTQAATQAAAQIKDATKALDDGRNALTGFQDAAKLAGAELGVAFGKDNQAEIQYETDLMRQAKDASEDYYKNTLLPELEREQDLMRQAKEASDDYYTSVMNAQAEELLQDNDYFQKHMEMLHKQQDEQEKAADQTQMLQQKAAESMLPPWQRAYAQIADEAANARNKVELELQKGEIDQANASAQIAAINTVQFGQMRDQLASDMETVFDDITSGNIGKAFLSMFKQLVFQMIATWLLSMQSMRAASAGAMGGGSGGILGTLFGGGIVGNGGTPPFVGNGSQAGISGLPGVITNFDGSTTLSGGGGDFGIGGLPLSLGGGALGGVILPAGGSSVPAGGAAAGAAAGAGGLLSKIFSHGVSVGGFTISGAQLAGLGAGLAISGVSQILSANSTGGRILGTAETIGGGALIGTSILPGIGTVIGAAIGGIVSLFSWLFGSGAKKKQQNALRDQLQDQLNEVQNNYDFFKVDYSTALADLEQLREQFADAESKVGGKQSQLVDPYVNSMIASINITEAERQRRAAMQFGPPQFRLGGYVNPALAMSGALHFATGGAVPAVLHAGEFVLRSEAVSRIGVNNLNAMNAGASGSGVVIHNLNISAVDAKSFQQFLRDGGMQEIIQASRLGKATGLGRPMM